MNPFDYIKINNRKAKKRKIVHSYCIRCFRIHSSRPASSLDIYARSEAELYELLNELNRNSLGAYTFWY
jgi:hypothetical protein